MPIAKTFTDYFSRYSNGEIKYAFQSLTPKYQNLIIRAYGENFSELRLDLLTKEERKILCVARTSLSNILLRNRNEKKLKQTSIGGLYEFFRQYKVEEINSAFKELTIRHQQILKKAYGKDLRETNITFLHEIEKNLLYSARRSLKMKILKQKYNQDNITLIQPLHIQLGLNEKQIVNLILKLNEKMKKDICYFFGTNDLFIEGLNEDEKNRYDYILITLKFLRCVKENSSIDNNLLEIASFFDFKECHDFISSLNVIQKLIVNAKLGFMVNGQTYSDECIAQILNISVSEVDKIFVETLWILRDFVKDFQTNNNKTKKLQ